MNSLKTKIYLVLMCLSGLQAYAQKNIDFIKKNASEIKIEFEANDYKDLADLQRKIGDSRLVLLGEQTHGDGTTIETKARIVKFLHEKMGFNILAFESSFYNAERSWDVLQWDKNPVNCIQNSTFELWGYTQQFLPLAEYIANSAKTERPLQITGFDTQLHGYFLKRDLPMDFMMFLKKYNIPFSGQEEQNTFFKAYHALVHGINQSPNLIEKERTNIQAMLPVFRKLLYQKIEDISSLPVDGVTSEWKQFWISTRAYLPFFLAEKKIETTPLENAASLRDSLMAENLIWLTNVQYPKDKIIVWAASWHIGKSAVSKQNSKQEISAKVMGDYLNSSLGPISYSICFTTYSGNWSWYNMSDSHPIDPPGEESFEALFHHAGFNNAFMDFKFNKKSPNGKWLNKARSMRPYGHQDLLRIWPKSFDAVIFNKNMTRALPIRN